MSKIKKYILSINPGNNDEMIKQIILSRPFFQIDPSKPFNLHYQETTPKSFENSKFAVYNHLKHNIKYHSKWQIYSALYQKLGPKIFDFTQPTYLFDSFEKRKFIAYIYAQKVPILWIMKPVAYNRGRGIAVVKSLEEAEIHAKSLPCKFIIQEYIERPLLYQKRKFDLRVFALITSDGSGYIYDVGYGRTTSSEYDILGEDLASHLTNNALQKKSDNYNKFEEGNMIDFEQIEEICDGRFQSEVWPKIKTIMTTILKTISDISGSLINCWELLGLDFMLDDTLKPIFIEANMNPDMKLQSPVSWSILPFLIDDLMQICIDQKFEIGLEVRQQIKKKLEEKRQIGEIFKPKTVQEWRDCSDKKIEGLRWDILNGGLAVMRENGFKQVMTKWK
ncbi:Tubulin tyrosine ligase [Spironucleus salmonicida]|uniref:Tubulin tyrosine ligase n=1 Tax=Spironucleus salmonicida TaxID=348837 RepID=V6LFL9_9EUKA|nr:Tubulin tyrosine ligase [Spironucleus salmonicida]|eukprot:EST43088.1 Tubulin tyrosine ligase [Spironucleus salmonicida]